MPFIVEQINVMFWAGGVVLFGGMTVFAARGEPRPIPVLVSIAIAYWFPAVLLAGFPFNPYRGAIDRRGHGNRLPTIRDLTELDRRILVCFYDPRNRRRAAGAVVALSVVVFAAARVGNAWAPDPRKPFPDSQSAVVMVAMGLPLAFLTGIFAMTIQVRREWTRIASTGPMWPESIEYPGRAKIGIASFFTGRFPTFLDVHPSGGS